MATPADSLEKLLGIDMTDPVQQLACQLVEDHQTMISNLVRWGTRDIPNAPTVEQKAYRMGVTPYEVVCFESGATDPTLSMIRRYALAVGLEIHSKVERHE